MSYDLLSKDCCYFFIISLVLGVVGVLWFVLFFVNVVSFFFVSNLGGFMIVDLILYNGCFYIVDCDNFIVIVVVIKDGKFFVVGNDVEVMFYCGSVIQVIDLQKCIVIFGFNDLYLYLICGGFNYNLELCWEGVFFLVDVLCMFKNQVECMFSFQWVWVVGGWNEFQFVEKCMLILEELNKVVLDILVFVFYLYDCVLFNCVVLCVVGYIKDMFNLFGGEIVCDSSGEFIGMLIVWFNVMIFYVILVKGLKLLLEYQVNFICQFMCEFNCFGLISVIDVGGGFQNYLDDYQVICELVDQGQFIVCIVYNLFIQKLKEEFVDFKNWIGSVKYGQGSDFFCYNGVGEMLVFFVVDFEDFFELCLDLLQIMEQELEFVVCYLVEQCWLFCLYVIYDELILWMFDVFEKVDCDILFNGLFWFFDYVEIIILCNIEWVWVFGGGIVIQDCMVFQGEYFVDCYGVKVVEVMLLIQCMFVEGVLVGVGIDVIWVFSYNFWILLYWLVSGCIVGGMVLYLQGLLWEIVLQLFIYGSVWFFSEQGKKGQIKVGQFVDLVVLLVDFFGVEEEVIKWIELVFMVVDGKVVYVVVEFDKFGLLVLLVLLDWLLVVKVFGYWW